MATLMDQLIAFYKGAGMPGPTIQDYEYQWLANQTSPTGKTKADMQRQVLGRVVSPMMPTGFTYSPFDSMSISKLMATTPFYVAHRGSGEDGPEHTMAAYQQSVDRGCTALEISLCVTSDGVLVCNHDPDLLETSDGAYPAAINTYTLAQLKAPTVVDRRKWVGGGWGLLPITTLDEVFAAFGNRVVYLIEVKAGGSGQITVVMDKADALGLKDNVIIKGFKDGNHSLVHARGYKLWGYFFNEIPAAIDVFAANCDYLGPVNYENNPGNSTTDANIAYTVGLGKKVILAEIHRREMRDKYLAMGVQGFMAASYPYLTRNTPWQTRDDFASGKKKPGEIVEGWALSYIPRYDGAGAYISMEKVDANQGQLMGSLCPITASTYRISFEARAKLISPTSTFHFGIAFGKSDDSPYLAASTANRSSGYHLIQRMNGQLQLYKHTAGIGPGTQLGTTQSGAALVADQWNTYTVDVTPTDITFDRQPDAAAPVTVVNNEFRGGYMHVSRNYAINDVPTGFVQFRNVVVS